MTRRQWLAATLGLLLASCGGARQDQTHQGITIGYQKNGVLFVASTRGEVSRRLEAEGIKPVRWVEFPSGPPLIEALRAGGIDFGHVGDTPVAYAQASGTDLLYVATHSFPASIANVLIVPKPSPIRSAADLKGKRLAFTRGSAAEVAALLALKKVGLTLNDVTVVDLTPGDAMTAFANGSIDAWITWDPYLTLAEERVGAREVPIDRAGIAAITFYVARGAWVRAHTPELRRVLDVLRDEAAWAGAHREEVLALQERATRVPLSVQRRILTRYGPEPFQVNPVSPADIANQQRISDLLFEANSLKRKVDARAAAWTGWTPKG